MGRYEPLTRYLEGRPVSKAALTFKEVEAILERSLPPSARAHQPWWANTATHSHADAWMRAGWKTSRVDLARERVVFVRDDVSARAALSFKTAKALEEEILIRSEDLSGAASALIERRIREHGGSAAQAIADLLTQAAIDRRMKILQRFPRTGEPSSVDSVDLIREDRDAR